MDEKSSISREEGGGSSTPNSKSHENLHSFTPSLIYDYIIYLDH